MKFEKVSLYISFTLHQLFRANAEPWKSLKREGIGEVKEEESYLRSAHVVSQVIVMLCGIIGLQVNSFCLHINKSGRT